MRKLFVNSLVLWALLGTAMPASQAEPEHHDEEGFDGAEFNASSFRDEDFAKQKYREEPGAERKEKTEEKEGRTAKKHRDEKEIKPAEGKDEKLSAKNVGENLGERTGPVHDLPGDWVPDKIDVTANGAFGVIPDNGSPVPFRLNGHVDIERGRPWEIHE